MPPATLFSKVPVIPGLGQHKVIQLKAAWDWTHFFNTLNVRMMGHTSTAAKKLQMKQRYMYFDSCCAKILTTTVSQKPL